jgi:SOS response regulatory protein OraA/RecX
MKDHYLESMFHYYQQSLFSIRKIKNKLYQKGFDQKIIDEFISTITRKS